MTSEPIDDEERRELEEALRLVIENLATLAAERNRIAGLVAHITEGLDEIAARSDRIAAILDSIDRRGGEPHDVHGCTPGRPREGDRSMGGGERDLPGRAP